MRRFSILMAGIAAVASIALVSSTRSTGDVTQEPIRNILAGKDRANPNSSPNDCLVKREPRYSIDDLDEVFPPLYFPDHPLANKDNIKVIYPCGPSAAFVHFTSGIEFDIAATEGSSPTSAYDTELRERPHQYTGTTVRGRKAVLNDWRQEDVTPGNEIDASSIVWWPADGWALAIKVFRSIDPTELQAIADSVMLLSK